MKIYRGLKLNQRTQGYGKENTLPSMIPMYQSLGLLGHDGWDWAVTCKDHQVKHGGKCEPIYCDIDGYATITYIQKDDAYGWGINALDQDGIHKHCYWHFDTISPELSVGSRIEGGMMLGLAGNTGYSTGAHLHRGLYEYGQEGNGYHGAIDITPYYQPIFIKDLIDNLTTQISIMQQIINFIKGLTK